MTFYKLTDYDDGDIVYVNPNFIEYYVEYDDYVLIETHSLHMRCFKSDFLTMMIKEGANEYWNTQHIIELLLITLIKL